VTGSPDPGNGLTLPSPSKINLFLRILEKREDGYHDIETLLQMVDLCDQLTFRVPTHPRIEIRSTGRPIPLGQENLVHRAVELVRKETGAGHGIEIEIQKNIPVSAGLGGGSGNAAVTLRALNGLWNLGLSKDQLNCLGSMLGADVPFFLNGPTAIGRGVGDRLESVSPPEPFPVVLVKPEIDVSTAWAYGATKIGLTTEKPEFTIPSFGFTGFRRGVMGFDPVNDLEPAVQERYPVVSKIKTRLKELGADPVRMSGSGPTVFGIFSDEGKAQSAYRTIRQEKWTSYLVWTIGRITDLYPKEVV